MLCGFGFMREIQTPMKGLKRLFHSLTICIVSVELEFWCYCFVKVYMFSEYLLCIHLPLYVPTDKLPFLGRLHGWQDRPSSDRAFRAAALLRCDA